MKIYEGPLGLVDVVGVQLNGGDNVVVSRPYGTTSRLCVGTIDKYNTDSKFMSIRITDFVGTYSWETPVFAIKYHPTKIYKVDRPMA